MRPNSQKFSINWKSDSRSLPMCSTFLWSSSSSSPSRSSTSPTQKLMKTLRLTQKSRHHVFTARIPLTPFAWNEMCDWIFFGAGMRNVQVKSTSVQLDMWSRSNDEIFALTWCRRDLCVDFDESHEHFTKFRSNAPDTSILRDIHLGRVPPLSFRS